MRRTRMLRDSGRRLAGRARVERRGGGDARDQESGHDRARSQTSRAAAPASTPVVCLQNGIENERIALRLFANVYGAVVMSPTAHLEPGIVQAYGTQGTGVIDLGRYPSGLDALSEEIANALGASDFSSMARPDIMRFKYAKLLSNLANAVDAICEPGPAGRGVDQARERRGRGRAERSRNRFRGRRGQRRRRPLGAARPAADRRPRARRLLDPAEHRARRADRRDRLPERRDRAARPPARRGRRRSTTRCASCRHGTFASAARPRRCPPPRCWTSSRSRRLCRWISSSLTAPREIAVARPARARGAGRGLLALGRRRGRRAGDRAVRGVPAAAGRSSGCRARPGQRRGHAGADRRAGPGRLLLLGHLDTVVAHAAHEPPRATASGSTAPGPPT